ncbi:hypothetical protein POM88_020720 [Heracleum sosnowskyi]|uniref:Survival protein SurE-like phosphatase/nucleotidase domain-containing protein n=1 Tax=Heracleum sosnowskyi TaxID=360622 RepID=A0AAD8ICD9_9APIA|nr:hypothetical protein POM88_020720 [Heracleum sosnowskyi]
MDSNWFQGLNFSLYSGTVAGAREAFFEGVPAISISYDWIGGKSTVKDFKLAAEACLPIINAILADVRNKKYPQKCFLNIDLPTDVLNQKVDHQISLMVGIELVTNKKDKTPTKAKTAVLFEKLRGMVGMDLLKMMVVGQTICRPQLK